jgi:hypothetical protein
VLCSRPAPRQARSSAKSAGSAFAALLHDDARGTAVAHHDALHVGAQAQLAAGGLDRAAQRLGKACRAAHRVVRAGVVGAHDQRVFDRGRFSWR